MSEDITPYGVSYIASAPDELMVGDRVRIINPDNEAYVDKEGRVGTIVKFQSKTSWLVDFGDVSTVYPAKYLRKIPDTTSFEDSFESAHGKNNPMDRQVGGSHYKDMVIQPIEFSMKNGLNACQHSIIKYICRYKNKNGKEDLLKAKHFIDLLIQMEYPE